MKRLFLTTLALVASIFLTGCYTRVETGAAGILKHWGGEISTTPAHGFNWTIFDSMVGHVDTTETRAPISNLRPSDSNGVMLDDLDLVTSFTLNPERVPAFYIQTKELDEYKDDTGREVTTVGLKVLENIVRHATQEVTKKQSLGTLAANLSAYEKDILTLAQAELNAGYPDVFKLVRVNINHFVPPTAILDQANRTAGLQSEVERNTQEQTLIAQRTQLEISKAAVEAKALKAAMVETGLSASDLIAWKNARAYETQAAAIAQTAVKTLEVGKQPAR